MSSINSKPRLIYVIDSQAIGGTEKYLQELSAEIKNEYDVSVVCPKYQVLNDWIIKIQQAKIRIIRDRINNIFDFKAIVRFLWLFKKADIVHFILPCPSSSRLGIICAKLAGVPVRIATAQLVAPPNLKYRIRTLYHKLSVKLVYSFLHQVITVSRESKRQLVQIFNINENKIKVIYNAIDVTNYQSSPTKRWPDFQNIFVKDCFYIAVVGRLHPQKGHQYLINAAPKIISVCPNCRFLFIGDGEEKNNLTQLIKRKELTNYFTFLGHCKHVNQILAHINLLVLPSLSEGFPFVILEAMAAGKPVVASNIGGNRESVENGITGFLVSPQNINDLTDAITFLIKDKRLARKMGRMGYKRVTKLFNLNRMVIKTNNVYQQFLA